MTALRRRCFRKLQERSLTHEKGEAKHKSTDIRFLLSRPARTKRIKMRRADDLLTQMGSSSNWKLSGSLPLARCVMSAARLPMLSDCAMTVAESPSPRLATRNPLRPKRRRIRRGPWLPIRVPFHSRRNKPLANRWRTRRNRLHDRRGLERGGP